MVKKGVLWVVVAFALYSVIATPDVAANAVRSAGVGGQHVVQAVLEFFSALTPSKSA